MSKFETPKLPEVKFNKNGYEIRTDVLAMAKELVVDEYHSKFAGWQLTTKKDATTGEITTKVEMPQYPGLDYVLQTAEQMYNFINQK